MSDLTQWNVRGPVHTLRTQFAEWNPETGAWQPPRDRVVVTFRRDGQLSEIEYRNPDGSTPREVRLYDAGGRRTEVQWWANGTEATGRVLHSYDAHGRLVSSVAVTAGGTRRENERCHYDERGRKTKVVVLSESSGGHSQCGTGSCAMHYEVEGSEMAVSAPGATTSTTTYDEHDRPLEVAFHDANQSLISRVVFERDGQGRVLSERDEVADLGGYFSPPSGIEVPAHERASLMALLETAFESQTMSMTTYAYDARGRRIETLRRMGTISEERVSVRYDDFDNPVEEVRSETGRSLQMDEGVVTSKDDAPRVQHVRYEYQYDGHGNWTERIIWGRREPETEEQRANIERRSIEYYGP